MNEPLPTRQTSVAAVQPLDIPTTERVILDDRRPQLLDHHGRVLKIVAGHVDLFAVRIVDGKVQTARQHLFRVECGEVIPDLFDRSGRSTTHVIAVGTGGAEAVVVRRADLDDDTLLEAWITKLARVIAGPNPSWDIRDASDPSALEIPAGELRRGPARAVTWVSVQAGTALLMGQEPAYLPATPPVPLASGMWIAAQTACTLGDAGQPSGPALWDALDHFHRCATAWIEGWLDSTVDHERHQLARRSELTTSQGLELFRRLSTIIVRRSQVVESVVDSSDTLLAACRTVAERIRMPITRPPGRSPTQQSFTDVVEIARASRIRVRRILLRGNWWKQDVGPLVAWHGETRDPVALVRVSGRYVMVDPKTAGRRQIDNDDVAQELDPEAVTFYPTLPSTSLTLRDLLGFSFRLARGNVARIVASVLILGLLSLVMPLIVHGLVDSVIPRTEIDQLVFCAIALAVTATAMAGVQMVESTAMLRLEGLIDWRLQAAVIDRVLRLPASLFREYTVGDFVDRALGIDAVRRILTGQTLRSLMAGLFCWFSILLMMAYDARLALIALALTFIRAFLIIGTSALRLYHESRQFNLQGKVEGLVLQLLAGIGKLRVAAATVRALAVWSKLFAAQKYHFIASQRAANALASFEIAFPTIATMVLFGLASTGSGLTRNLGAFLAFMTAFGQAMASIGTWANGVSASLVAIPHITRIRPLISAAAEISDDRKAPGELTGGIELSRVTFRYMPAGPPVIDNVTLRIAPGEYVAIVGPSGSGKSSLFRLLLGFEKPESGAVFFDGKALDTLDISAVRRQLGVVLQNGKLATGSLYENICGGLPLPLEQAWEAARLAGLDVDIKRMPMGMHTTIAEGVNTLSGGQRQRVMIARAIARRPRILLFDEATSSLDNSSQAIVSDSLGALNVTRIAIAHRLSTVREADRIVVLVEGKIVQTGTFAELNDAKGVFADFARRQLL